MGGCIYGLCNPFLLSVDYYVQPNRARRHRQHLRVSAKHHCGFKVSTPNAYSPAQAEALEVRALPKFPQAVSEAENVRAE